MGLKTGSCGGGSVSAKLGRRLLSTWPVERAEWFECVDWPEGSRDIGCEV
jgi:hypothetical protein